MLARFNDDRSLIIFKHVSELAGRSGGYGDSLEAIMRILSHFSFEAGLRTIFTVVEKWREHQAAPNDKYWEYRVFEFLSESGQKDDPYLPNAPMNFLRRWRKVVESFSTGDLPDYQVQLLERVKKHYREQDERRKRDPD